MRTVALLGFLLTSNVLFGQGSNYTDIFLLNPFAEELKKPNHFSDFEEEGSQYFDSTFVKGEIFVKETRYIVPMRYNAYLDILEAKSSEVILYINKNIVDSVSLNNLTYVFKKAGNEMRVFNVLDRSDKGIMLENNSISFDQGRFGVLHKDDIYPHYKTEKPVYYYYLNPGKMINLTSYNDLYNYFPDKKAAIKSFIRKEKLKKNKKNDLIRLFGFVTEL